jgi:hypothetical protein
MQITAPSYSYDPRLTGVLYANPGRSLIATLDAIKQAANRGARA